MSRPTTLKDGKATSEPDNIKQALRPVRQLYGDTLARDFGPLALKAVRQSMIDQKNTLKVKVTDEETGEVVVEERILQHGLSRQHINRQLNRIKKMVAWAAGEELLPISVYQGLTTVEGFERVGVKPAKNRPSAPCPRLSSTRRCRTFPRPWRRWSGSRG